MDFRETQGIVRGVRIGRGAAAGGGQSQHTENADEAGSEKCRNIFGTEVHGRGKFQK